MIGGGIIRGGHDMRIVREHLKFWGILGQVYRHGILKHSSVFYACAVITQLTVANKEPLFEVEYGNSIISSY